ncbi:hypothetical protein ACFQZE_13225 [Paenibacillus sp. GCM10027627]|uniref:hypothetical protein n=1 Tax=unclassified Paenibacillus TaxID=185978 RepID=UPI0036380D86
MKKLTIKNVCLLLLAAATLYGGITNPPAPIEDLESPVASDAAFIHAQTPSPAISPAGRFETTSLPLSNAPKR